MRRWLPVALAALIFAPHRAQAQDLLEEPRPRQGYYLAFGLSAAVDHNWLDARSVGTFGGDLVSVRLGELITRRFGLGLRLDAGGAKNGPQRATLAGLAVETQWELVRNLAIHGAIGLGVVSLKDSRDVDNEVHGTAGAGYTLALSYDWFTNRRLTGGFALTPVVTARFVPGTSATALVGLLGLELTYWTGLPRSQLRLSEPEAWRH